MQIDKAILRIFDVRAKSGQAQVLKQKLSETSVSVVVGQPGNLGYFFGESLSSDDHDLVFISIWKDLESIKSRFGERWEESYLPEGYEDLIEHCSIKHVAFKGSLNLDA